MWRLWPGSAANPLAMKAGAKTSTPTEVAQKAAENLDNASDEVKTIVFLATVFKYPSSILNQ